MIVSRSQLDASQSVLYDGIDWETYERILAAFGDRRLADGKGGYSSIKKSAAFPFLTTAVVERFVDMLTMMDGIIDQLVAWLDWAEKGQKVTRRRSRFISA
jgi:hypothetical protein